MRLLAIGLVTFSLLSTSYATESDNDDIGSFDVVGSPCQDRLDAITGGIASAISISHLTYRHAGAALKHYRKEVLHGASESEVHISEATAFQDGNGRVLGRKVSITDGGDESLVEYFYDHRRKLVSAFWHNQSPILYWFCQH